MSSIKIREHKICSEYEVPKLPVISEGDKLLKNMIDKQLNKKIRLQDELARIKYYEQPRELINETEFLSGQNNITIFKQRTEYLEKIQDLKSCGLTDEEIELYEDNQKGEEYLLLKHKNMCSNVLQEKLNHIFSKLKDDNKRYELKYLNGISRHIKEIALSTKPDSLETKLFQFATSTSQNEICNEPVNSFKRLDKELFGHLNNPHVPSLKKRRKKAKKFLDVIETNEYSIKSKSKTNWDLKEVTATDLQLQSKEKSTKIYSCASQKKYTIRNNKIIPITSSNNEKQEFSKCAGKPFIASQNNSEQNVMQKLNEEEIKKLPRFQNYNKGIPSKVLFIKNLAKQINEQDLLNLFNLFDNEAKKITYRLLTGKMQGQAFVTFNSVEKATKALESLNGTIIKNKPIIIQYGKSA